MSSPYNPGDFDTEVRLKYQVYNSLFLTLPFDLIHETGTLLPLLAEHCQTGFSENRSPEDILRSFFAEYLQELTPAEQTDVLFNFVKYIERQVVLFDAVEEAAFQTIHDMDGPGTINDFLDRITRESGTKKLRKKLEDFRLRLVLTAHPTQFYPGTVLGIITDLAHAIRNNDIAGVKELLLQLGKTPFINADKPTPLDEARSLIWYLRNVFYRAIPVVIRKILDHLKKNELSLPPTELITLGFWPGGDRDGNPFVNTDITVQTMALLHRSIMSAYHEDMRELRRRLTFKDTHDLVIQVEYRLFDSIHQGEKAYTHVEELLDDLNQILSVLRSRHNGLFAELLEALVSKVNLFGFHFATLDIRQDSRKHEALMKELLAHAGYLEKYETMEEAQKISFLHNIDIEITPDDASEDISRDIISSIRTMHDIQAHYGSRACHRYIISNARNALDVVIILTLIRWVQGNTKNIDVVPLFESVSTLRNCGQVMETLYLDPVYADHLSGRHKNQTIMLGFSDGTKDGGYLRANWSIFQAKEELTAVSRNYNMRVLFFDGRGGPPARGGGNLHKFYSSLGATIDNHEVQLTVQGQTISSHYGSPESAIYNLEQLFTAGLEQALFRNTRKLTSEQTALISHMAEGGYQKYMDLRERPEFLQYLKEVGTLQYYGETNISSRPVKRGGKTEITLSDLRAIPFVSTWSQLKQNVPGYYGFGYALSREEEKNNLPEVKKLYTKSGFFQTLVGNSMQSLSKTFFPLTAYLRSDEELSEIWNLLYDEYKLTVRLLMEISGQKLLLEDAPNSRESIAMREEIILPILTIQQAAIQRLRKDGMTSEQAETYRKLILRTMYGIINAGRNSV